MTTEANERRRPEHFLSLIRNQQRGRLKIYLGFAPGVGKTYLMLQEGQRLVRQAIADPASPRMRRRPRARDRGCDRALSSMCLAKFS